MSKFTNRNRKGVSIFPSPPRYQKLKDCSCCSSHLTDENFIDYHHHHHEVIKKGYVPVMIVGEGEEGSRSTVNNNGTISERFLIPTQLMTHPSILTLLQQSAEEFGYAQDGVIRIPCDIEFFRRVVKSLPVCKKIAGRRNIQRVKISEKWRTVVSY